MIRKLRIKLILASMLSLFAVLCVILGIAGMVSYQKITRSADRVLGILEENGGNFPEPSRRRPDKPGDEKEFLGDHRFSPELPYESRYFSVSLDSQGNPIETDTGKIAAVDEEEAIAYARNIWEKGREKGFVDDYRYLVDQTQEEIHIVFLDCGRDLNAFSVFMASSILVAGAGLAAVFLLLLFVSGRIVRPFSENYEKQKRFITDAGHELKTPLTIIDADAELLEMDLGENEWLGEIRNQTKRLTNLTNSLVLLARMEEEQPRIPWIEFPLSDVAEEAVTSFQALAKTQNKNLTWEIQPMISMKGDETALRRMIAIFLDNAVKYSQEGGRIRLTLEKQKNQIRLSVFNTAYQVQKKDLPYLFDRFYRTDQSRNSQTGGYGLGLAIAAAIVSAHKGKITAATEDEKSLLITVTFPA